MRAFDLYHYDTGENAEWNDVQALMDRMQSGMEIHPYFELWEPGEGNLIIQVGLAAVMEDTVAWLLSREMNGAKYFLAKAFGDQYYECMWWGCPELIRDCCLLSRSDADVGIKTLLHRQKLHVDWHWLPATQVIEPSNR